MMDAGQLIDRYVGVWNGGDPGALDALLTPGFVRHAAPAAGPAAGPAGLRQVIAAMRVDVPDLTITVEDLLVTSGRIVFRWTSTGTDSGPGDFPPTNRRFTMPGITWIRLEDGRIAEEWSASDQLDVMLQLGFRVLPPEA